MAERRAVEFGWLDRTATRMDDVSSCDEMHGGPGSVRFGFACSLIHPAALSFGRLRPARGRGPVGGSITGLGPGPLGWHC